MISSHGDAVSAVKRACATNTKSHEFKVVRLRDVLARQNSFSRKEYEGLGKRLQCCHFVCYVVKRAVMEPMKSLKRIMQSV